MDELSKGRVPRPTRLEFYVRENSQLRRLEAQLSASGSLSPLFFAFGLVSADEMRAADNQSLASDTNMLAWLQDQVQEAVRTAEKHDIFKWHIRRLKSSLEEKFQLAAVQVRAAQRIQHTRPVQRCKDRVPPLVHLGPISLSGQASTMRTCKMSGCVLAGGRRVCRQLAGAGKAGGGAESS